MGYPDAIAAFVTAANEIPEIKAIFDGCANEAEALSHLMGLMSQRPDLAQRIEKLAQEKMGGATLEPQLPATTLDGRGDVLGIDPGSRWVIPDPSGAGRSRLNPVYEAAIVERTQFDGDVPELRTGPMNTLGTPAVPVETDARSPVAIGMMLEDAANEVKAEMKALTTQHEDHVHAIVQRLEAGEDPDQVMGKFLPMLTDPTALLTREFVPEPEGYKRGEVPALRSMKEPEGWALATLDLHQQQQLTWKFISTSQGRRTASAIIRRLIHHELQWEGILCTEWDGEPRRVPEESILAYHEWAYQLSGPGSTQPSFSFIDVAAKVLTSKLIASTVQSGGVSDLMLEVFSLNTVDVRRVGWAARLSRLEIV